MEPENSENSVITKGVADHGSPDVLGTKMLTLGDLDGVTRIGEEEIQDLDKSSLNRGNLDMSKRIGEEIDTNLGARLDKGTKTDGEDFCGTTKNLSEWERNSISGGRQDTTNEMSRIGNSRI